MADDKVVARFIASILVAGLFIAALIVLRPILIAILVGFLLAYIFQPLYKKIISRVKSPTLSTFILLLLILVLIAIPIWYLAPIFINQTFETYKSLQNLRIGEVLANLLPNFFGNINQNAVSIQFNTWVSQFFSSLMKEATEIIVKIPNLLLQIATALFTFFFATRDSSKLKEYVHSLSPFSKRTGETFFNEFRNITNALVYGQILIGLIQGLTLGFGLLMFKAPSPLLLTTLAIFTSIIPVLGSWVIWLPTSLLMMISGHILMGSLLLIYGMVLVSSLDNLLRPYFLSRNSTLPLPVALIGTIGGLYVFGLIGLILGPLILAYLLIVVDFYRKGKLKELFKN